MKGYYKLMLGPKSRYVQECLDGGFVGVDFKMDMDFSSAFPDDWRVFNKTYIPVYLQKRPDKTKIAAGLACGAIWTLGKGMQKGDIVLSPDGKGNFLFAEVTGDYSYHPGQLLPHRRAVRWLGVSIPRKDTSDDLRTATTSVGTISNISPHAAEIEKYLSGQTAGANQPFIDPSIEDFNAFSLEKQLETFLIENWIYTDLGKEYDIYEEEGEKVGQQFKTDTGPIDILAISKDKKELLVVELKRGRASDVVVGQIQRYMGYIKDEMAEAGQMVKGVIIARDDDRKIQRALSVTNNISFLRYEISFKLFKA